MWSEKIDSFLSGKMSGAEAAEFQAEVAGNPELQSELAMQKDLIETLRENRKSELKARLAQIPVSTGMTTMQKGGLIAASLLALIGGSAVVMNLEDGQSSKKVALGSQEVQKSENIANKDSEEIVVIKNEVEVEMAPAADNNIDEPSNVVVEFQGDEGKVDPSLLDNIGAPDIDDNGDENAPGVGGDNDLPGFANNDVADNKAGQVQTERINVNANELKYKYDGDKLTLSGKFGTNNAAPTTYELKNKSMYIEYKGNYYALPKTGGKLKNLTSNKVDDPAIIEKLKSAK